MSCKITGDSYLDLIEELEESLHFQMTPLTLRVDDVQVIDNKAFNQKKSLAMMKVSPNCPKTACPSPEMFKEAYEYDTENILVTTLSSNLSGTYNSAVLAKGLYEKEHRKRSIAVIDPWSASSGGLDVGLMIRDLCKQRMSSEEVVEKAIQYTQHEMKMYFMLESPDTLRKNGQLSGLQAFFVTTLNARPVMGTDKGSIIELDQAGGVNRAFVRMRELAVKEAKDPETLRVTVAHCNDEARAQPVRKELPKRAPFEEIIMTETAGVATAYANDGGVILTL